MKLTEENLLEIYDLVFSNIHSIGFKTAEIKNLLFESDYWFLENPKSNWKINLMAYLKNINYDTNNLNMNKSI